MSELPKTPEGKEKHYADERNRMSELCKTPDWNEKHCADERNRMSELWKTPEGKDNHREDERMQRKMACLYQYLLLQQHAPIHQVRN